MDIVIEKDITVKRDDESWQEAAWRLARHAQYLKDRLDLTRAKIERLEVIVNDAIETLHQ